MAREIAGAFGLKFTDPVEKLRSLTFEKTGEGVQPKIEDKEAASVFYLRTMSQFDPKAATPMWMRRRIEKMGMRSISLVVDVTNYVIITKRQLFGRADHSIRCFSIRFTSCDGKISR